MHYYCGFWRRFVASLIDMLILFIPVLLLVAIEMKSLAGIIPLFYYAFFENSNKQATLGKMALGIKVVDLNGNRITFFSAIARTLCKSISALFMFGFIMAAFTDKKQAFHDIAAGTFVVEKAVDDNKEMESEVWDLNDEITGIDESSQYNSTRRPIKVKFLAALLIVLGLGSMLNIILLYKSSISPSILSIVLSILIITSGIGIIYRKKWAWWIGCAGLTYLFVTGINNTLNLPTSVERKLESLPFAGLLMISVFWIYSEEVVNYFDIVLKPAFRRYIIPGIFLCLSMLIIFGGKLI